MARIKEGKAAWSEGNVSHSRRMTSDPLTYVEELKGVQEEANTIILLHIKYASTHLTSAIIIAEDTDIMIRCLSFQEDIGMKYICQVLVIVNVVH